MLVAFALVHTDVTLTEHLIAHLAATIAEFSDSPSFTLALTVTDRSDLLSIGEFTNVVLCPLLVADGSLEAVNGVARNVQTSLREDRVVSGLELMRRNRKMHSDGALTFPVVVTSLLGLAVPHNLRFGNSSPTMVYQTTTTSGVDLDIQIFDGPDGTICVNFDFNANVFSTDFIRDLGDVFLQSTTTEGGITPVCVEVPAVELFESDGHLHSLVLSAAAKFPTRPAVKCHSGRVLLFDELHEMTTAFARGLHGAW
jgi:non-ribosomal peptide synthetase component F